jgi:hypothetical protein
VYCWPDWIAVHVSTQFPKGDVGPGPVAEHGIHLGAGGVFVQSTGSIQQVPGPTAPHGWADGQTWAQNAPGSPQSSDVLHVTVPTPHWPAVLAATPLCRRWQSFQYVT